MKTFHRTSLLVALALAAGCTQSTPKPQTPPPAGTVQSFSATPTVLAQPGDKTTLAWSTKDATQVTLEQVGAGPIDIQGAASGTTDVALQSDTVFLLTARGPGGTDSAAVAVKVGHNQSGVIFSALPPAITAGDATTLVWNAPGAQTVTVTEVGGQPVDLLGQGSAGSVRVTPAHDVQYQLTAGTAQATVDVSVAPAIFSFTAQGSPLAGEPVNLAWTTGGASQVVLTRAGVTAPLATVTDPAMVASGTFSETAPSLPPDGVLHYVLTASGSSGSVTKGIDVRIGGSVTIDQFDVPAYARSPGQYNIAWKTTGATSLELQLDGQVFYVSPNQTTTDTGVLSLPSPAASQTLTLVARNDRSQASASKTVEAVGPATFVSFTADKTTVANGGEPVQLSWAVTNARAVKIIEVGGPVVVATQGHVDTGTATVYPNRPSVTYRLTADNGAGDAITPQELTVGVTTLATLTFDNFVPAGAQSNVTGSTVVGGGAISGLPNVVKNAAGEAFVDISQTGTALDHGYDTAAYVNPLPDFFYTRVFGRRVYLDSISLAVNGWFFFSTTSVDGPNTNSPTFGTALEPLAIAPYWRDLSFTGPNSNAYAQVDVVNGVQRLIVQWDQMEEASTAGSVVTVEAQVYGDGKIVFAYGALDGLPAGNATIGVVNGSETDAVVAPDQPVAGDTYTFFGPVTLPAPIRVENQPYVASVALGTGFVEVEGDARLLPGQFAITELNPKPGVGVTNGEWIEVTSFGNQLVDLMGWTIDFGGTNQHLITTSVPLPPGGRVLLAQAADLGDTGAPAATYVYPSTFAMPDNAGTVALTLAGGAYSSVTWDATAVPDAGIAVKADPNDANLIYSGTLQQLVCPGTSSPTYGSNGQLGTPRAPQTRCFPYRLGPPPGAGSFVPIGSTGTPLVLGSAGSSATDEKVYPVTLTEPISYYGRQVSTLYVSTNGWITATSTTSAAYSNRTTPSSSAPNGSIAPFWDDLVGVNAPDSGIFVQQFDPDMTPGSGDEYTIISWEDWKTYSGTTVLNFQVRFGPFGAIEYDYGTMTGTTGQEAGSSATTWLEDPTGKAALKLNINSATAPGIAPNSGFRLIYAP